MTTDPESRRTSVIRPCPACRERIQVSDPELDIEFFCPSCWASLWLTINGAGQFIIEDQQTRSRRGKPK